MGLLNLAEVAALLNVPYSGSSESIEDVEVDSRQIQRGDLFIAAQGAQVDGHDFIEAAAERGAVAAIVERDVTASIPCLKVADSLDALTRIGAANRDAYTGVLVAVTGSCGKTSVKNMCGAIFSGQGPTVATQANYNNEIGVPLTLARLNEHTRYAVVEMGATGRGHIAHLCRLARPQISTVLNAMEAHLDGFGTVADVADIKAEIFEGLGVNGTAVLNLDQPWVSLWRERIVGTGARTLSYSLSDAADVRATEVRSLGLRGSELTLSVGGQARSLTLALPGAHNVANALAAAAMAAAAGLSVDAIADGLSVAETEPGRLQAETLPDGTVLIDDSYNANPGSVRAAIDLLAETPGERCLILGEMLELGETAAKKHAEMGERAREQGIQRLLGVGEALKPAMQAFGPGAECYPTREALAPALPKVLDASDVVLVKGSRGAAMETVLQDLREIAGGDR